MKDRMPTLLPSCRLLGTALVLVSLAACSSFKAKPEPVPVPTLDELLGKAAQAANAGQGEQAVTLWKAAAAAHPADKAAWANVARTRFESGQYGEAIVHAQEVLVRDPNDRQASSIIAASALRLATRALADLGRQKGMTTSLQKETQELTRVLRVSMGRDDDAERAPPPRARIRTVEAAKPRPRPDCTPDNPLCQLLK
jgi:tetratricopeptide (TPR) repeat protein